MKYTRNALFINGVYQSVLDEIIEAQASNGTGVYYLQPYSGSDIVMFRKRPPTPDVPVRLYLSTTGDLNRVCCIADCIGWERKALMSDERRQEVLEVLNTWQPGEVDYFTGAEQTSGQPANLLTIRHLRRIKTLPSTSWLVKVKSGLPLRHRTRAGGWSEVYDRGELDEIQTTTEAEYDEQLSHDLERSKALTREERKRRLQASSGIPARVEIISHGFKRNADVITETLLRAAGICERCRKPAPFNRKSDGTPFLEVHHWKPLSEGGEDTVENAGALCPNCHREVHHG